MTTPRTPAVQDRSDVENAALEVLVHEDEELAFTRRAVEDLGRIWFALANGLPGPAEQMTARLLDVAQRRHRQLAHVDVDLRRWGVK